MKSVIAAAALVCSLLAAGVSPARGDAVPATSITVNGDGGALVYDGVGAVLGGGGNARYLEDYPPAQRTDATLTHGMPGIEVGGWYPAYFSNLAVITP